MPYSDGKMNAKVYPKVAARQGGRRGIIMHCGVITYTLGEGEEEVEEEEDEEEEEEEEEGDEVKEGEGEGGGRTAGAIPKETKTML